MAAEVPPYEVVQTYPEFELRRYAPYRVAETEVAGDFEAVGRTAFRILADYIFGNNRAREKMEMTAPATQRPSVEDGERIAMTAPVTQRAKPGAATATYVLGFVMPSRYTLDTLPEPVDPRVRLCEEPARQVAVLRYSGMWTEAAYREKDARLLEAVATAGLKPVSAPVYARYNSPFSPWFLRRNEVMVEGKAANEPVVHTGVAQASPRV